MAKFVLKPTYEYWWPVKIKIPNGDPKRGGGFTDQSFNAQFRSIGLEESKELLAASDGDSSEFIKAVVIGWDESLVDEVGDAVPFSDGALTELLGNVWVLRAFWAAWNESISGDAAKK